ncbi:putative ABC-type exoprotein transport system permease subunit [Tumebacillus sp. BK434]|uniref:ABC transporter permease n=1 Tax=Tumebacillus sp. BK434 TaxID=2512169 RepID=UPI001047DADB|nr:ABC transporter permease [Tumebacillus sp. BK434]TCP58051.1 putative ABC-type exoprotein transport system permease subunit [Tumebacillus sp. BK434]
MKSLQDLYAHRLKTAWRNGLIYALKAGRNVALPMSVPFVAVGIAFVYRYLLEIVPASFPSELFLAVVLAYFLTKCKVRTFIKEPDLVFLLPAEARMKEYFQRAVRYSSWMGALTFSFVMGMVLPFYLFEIGDLAGFFLVWALLIFVKVWNVREHWRGIAWREPAWVTALRFLANVGLAWMIVHGFWFAVLLPFVLFPLRKRWPDGYPWSDLMELEKKTVAGYLAFANFFVDVPEIMNRVREWKFKQLPWEQGKPFLFLYTRTFLRHSEYFGIAVRITLTAFVGLFFVTNLWIGLGVYLLALYITGKQMPNMATERKYPDVMELYPLEEEAKLKGYSQLSFGVMVVQSVLLFLPVLIAGLPWWYLPAGLVLAYLLAFYDLPTRFRERMEEKKS